MTTESIQALITAHLKSRNLALADADSGEDPIDQESATYELAEMISDAVDSDAFDAEDTREVSPDLLANLRAASRLS